MERRVGLAAQAATRRQMRKAAKQSAPQVSSAGMRLATRAAERVSASGPTAKVKDFDGNEVTVKVGDAVGFKSDHEQYGRITKIVARRDWSGRVTYDLHLNNPNGFGGDYLRYATDTVENADDCWI